MLPGLLVLVAAIGQLSVGEPAPPWQLDDTTWERTADGAPLTLEELKGKAVLLRWFTEKTCPHCRKSAPALNAWHARYAGAGLQVVGIYHHKRPGSPHPDLVAKTAHEYGFDFPTVVDQGWKTLKSWWLDHTGSQPGQPRWTSVTFLLDRQGKVAHIHPGGSYEKGDPAHAALEQAIKTALAETP